MSLERMFIESEVFARYVDRRHPILRVESKNEAVACLKPMTGKFVAPILAAAMHDGFYRRRHSCADQKRERYDNHGRTLP